MFHTISQAMQKGGRLMKLLPLFLLLLFAGASPARADETVRQQDADGYYRLQSAADLQWFADLVYQGNRKACGRLYADIDLSELGEPYWRPIGGVQPGWSYVSHVFKGKFDGQNHTISGLKIRPFPETGLFGRTDSATIENVTVYRPVLCDTVFSLDYSKNSKNLYGSSMAVIVGNAAHTTVRNCHVRDAVVKPSAIPGGQKWYMVGGICGAATDESLVSLCSMSGAVVTSYEGAGGIVGYLDNSDVNGCRVLPSTRGYTVISASDNAGGVCGATVNRSAAAAIVDCHVTDSIRVYATGDGATAADTLCGAEKFPEHAAVYKGYYEIYTPDHLAEFASKVNGGETSAKARLMRDINMSQSGDFTPRRFRKPSLLRRV